MPYEFSFELTIDRANGVTLREQIIRQVKAAISRGTLAPDDPLPSTRAVADILGVSRTTVLGCYQELEGDGWVYGAHGAGTFVARVGTAARAAVAPPSTQTDLIDEPEFDFRPGAVDPTIMTPLLWRTLWRAATPSASPAAPSGLAQLRASIANYLVSARGLDCTPEQIVVCAGTAEALTLLCVALGWAGKQIAVEDPGYPEIRNVLRRLSARVIPLDVTDPSRIADNLDDSEALAAVYLTPSHQYPLGHRLDTDQRKRVLDWANHTGAVIVEDDYDGEFHFGVSPSTCMAGLSPQANIVYVGTVSKVLDPGLRLAYMRLPPHLLREVISARDDLGSSVAAPIQVGIATLMQTGEMSRHIARARRIYADRRRVLLQSLDEIPAIRQLRGIEAGLHVVADLAGQVNPTQVVLEAAQRGIAVVDLDGFRTRPEPSEPALVFGYTRHPPSVIRTAIADFAQCPELNELPKAPI